MTTFKSMPVTEHKPVLVIKLGGSLLQKLTSAFYKELAQKTQSGQRVVIVHGGGPAINKQLEERSVSTTSVNGLRVTSPQAMEIVQSTLAGLVNPSLVHELTSAGIRAVGLNGFDDQMLTCTYLDQDVYGCVGEIQTVQTELIQTLMQGGFVPVLSCIGRTKEGMALNVNADTVAAKTALALQAEALLLVTDTEGIKLDGKTQNLLTPEAIKQSISSGDIYGGMIPKVHAAFDCLEAGVASVHIVGESLQGTQISQEVKVH
ncbi:acetylglutamate kinase [Jeotgalibacillus campisalis]|uniref:Acetylglutamate kinase n=1 Tax=Jeotgalibacillus campisalis TaxID=220754 RepID=A0A0C2SFX1_9BACL|nr:acetylglutamate kinase [Jeotgalibacillus campisalis]KIL52829.1 acetylglutamate kinase [Jeotgalibacillus campisalis]